MKIIISSLAKVFKSSENLFCVRTICLSTFNSLFDFVIKNRFYGHFGLENFPDITPPFWNYSTELQVKPTVSGFSLS